MAGVKVTGITDSCKACPNRTYYSGSVYRCRIVDERIIDDSIVAPFCPLADYPSRVIAAQQMTIKSLREANNFGMEFALMSFIATRLKRDLEPSGRHITIYAQEGVEKMVDVVLGGDFIASLSLQPAEVNFRYDGKAYRLSLGGDHPILWRAEDAEGRQWSQLTILPQ